jgi:hypothetical protein
MAIFEYIWPMCWGIFCVASGAWMFAWIFDSIWPAASSVTNPKVINQEISANAGVGHDQIN